MNSFELFDIKEELRSKKHQKTIISILCSIKTV